MFNLIISIIAIALVVVLAGASLYYGGDAFNSGSSDAKAATFINQAQQIQAGATLFKANEGGDPANLAALTTDGAYLSAVPEAPVDESGVVLDWEIHAASTTFANVATDIVAIQVAQAATADLGVTGEICDTINADGAGVVFCEAGADATAFDGAVAADQTYTDGEDVLIFMEL